MGQRKQCVVQVVDTLEQVQKGLHSDDPAVVDAAESVLSCLIIHLRFTTAILPSEIESQLDKLTG